MTVEWDGGKPPYELLLVPTGHLHPETRAIIYKTIESGHSTTFTLNYPGHSRYVAMMSDATGVGTGGTIVHSLIPTT